MIARKQEGIYLVKDNGGVPIDVPFVLSEFGRLCQEDPRVREAGVPA